MYFEEDIIGINLEDKTIFSKEIVKTNFEKCSLKRSKFNNSNFKDTVFYECNLENRLK